MNAAARLKIAAVLLALLAIGLAIGESTGWPVLVGPLQRRVETLLDRPLRLSENGGPTQVSIRLLPRLRVRAAYVRLDAPGWSAEPHMLLARDVDLQLRYVDLLRARRGQALHVHALSASMVDARLERVANGDASWQFNTADAADDAPARLPTFGSLKVTAGKVVARDALTGVDLDATFSMRDQAPDASLVMEARGTYRQRPLKIDLRAGGLPTGGAVPVTLQAQVGAARLGFNGTASDAQQLGNLKGRFTLDGPSLAAVGEPLGLTLPTTARFSSAGLITRDGARWLSVLERIEIGSSRLAGAFTFDTAPRVPLLAGRLTGSRLLLADLGPTIGVPVREPDAGPPTRTGRVLPDRPFDLPSLRAMDAQVQIDIEYLDLGARWLEPLKPLHAQLVLQGGVLRLDGLQASIGPGRFSGALQLDGRADKALWTAAVQWRDVPLEQWLRQPRANQAPPWVTGKLAGNLRLAGQGKSTAAILGNLRGGMTLKLSAGSISHLAVEAAGIDVAEALGMVVKGDDALPVQCAVAELVAEQGVLRPRVMVLDTGDSTMWVDGTISLAHEELDLRLAVSPKDFSPLALRSPLHVKGSLADPSVSIEKSPVAARVAAAGLLALINPLAALIPFIDTGNSAEAERGAADCRALSARLSASTARRPPAPAPSRPGG